MGTYAPSLKGFRLDIQETELSRLHIPPLCSLHPSPPTQSVHGVYIGRQQCLWRPVCEGEGTGRDGTTEEWMRKKEWEKGHERRDEEDEQGTKEETHDNKEAERV